MEFKKLQSDMVAAMKARDKARKDTISSLISAVKKLAIDEGKRDDIPEELVDRAIIKEEKTAQEQVDSLHQQIEAAKLEITQPFPQALELTTKSARLAELDALLSMDKSAPMNNKSEKPSVLASLERGSSGMQKDTPQRRSDRPLDAAL